MGPPAPRKRPGHMKAFPLSGGADHGLIVHVRRGPTGADRYHMGPETPILGRRDYYGKDQHQHQYRRLYFPDRR
jgi:hypothetical protein